MAIAFDNTNSVKGVGVSSLSFAFTCTGSDLVLVASACTDDTPPTVTGVTYNSVAMTSRWNVAFRFSRSTGWTLADPATGSNTLAATFGATASGCALGCVSLTGASDAAAAGTTNSGETNAPTVTVTSAASPEWVVDGMYGMRSTAPTVGANQTSRTTQTAINSLASFGMSTQLGADGGVMSWTLGTGGLEDSWVTGGVRISEAAGGGGGRTTKNTRSWPLGSEIGMNWRVAH